MRALRGKAAANKDDPASDKLATGRCPALKGSSMENVRQSVVVTDIDMPFWSMVGFMIKWAIAAIPAMIVLFILFSIIGAILAAVGLGLTGAGLGLLGGFGS